MPKPNAGDNPVVAVLSEAIWRNQSNTECILGTHLQMNNSRLANGQYWEVNDIARGGFAGKSIAIAYFYKPHSTDEGGNTEVLFRAGRTFTSVVAVNNGDLPSTKNAPPANSAFSYTNAAAISENWLIFTTDVSFKDSDDSTREMTSIFYVKYSCDARDPVSKPNAIHLRSAMQNGKAPIEVMVSGLVPIEEEVEVY